MGIIFVDFCCYFFNVLSHIIVFAGLVNDSEVTQGKRKRYNISIYSIENDLELQYHAYCGRT